MPVKDKKIAISTSATSFERRVKFLRLFIIALTALIFFRLFMLQVVNASFYKELASEQHDLYQELVAQRGDIIVTDWKDGSGHVCATNELLAFVYADPRKIEDAKSATESIARILGFEITEIDDNSEVEEEQSGGLFVGEQEDVEVDESVELIEDIVDTGPDEFELLYDRLSKHDDPYEPVASNVTDSELNKILELKLDGIDYVLKSSRSYPETGIGGHIFGFVSNNDQVGQYGVEGYYNDFLSGVSGFLDIATDIGGSWIGVGKRNFEPAVDGGDIVLTIDRTIQYTACEALKKGVEKYEADGGSVVILEPSTGAIIAMCNESDFDPNDYSEVEDISVYNNNAIFGAYEPGSVFKPLIMSAALDIDAVSPTETYEDLGEVKIDKYTIRNSDLKANGVQTMTEVLEKSLNTGMIYVMRQMGGEVMTKYIEDYGFGTLSGIELDSESAGTIDALYNDAEIYYATASYGQGITATPLQIALAYGAMANEGWLMEPHIVKEKRYNDGTVEYTTPKKVRQVIDEKTATTLSAMMVSVVENGHGKYARVDGYYIAGKTGTAQVAKESGGGYEEDETIGTFAGFGPVEDPRFVMVVRIDHPRTTEWGESTAAPIFGEIAEFILNYLEVPPNR